MEQSNRTSGALWYGVLACWAVATGILAWRFLPNLTPDFLGVAQVFLLACLSYFLLTGVFNVVVNVWSRFLHTPNPTRRVEGTPRVALLYCTYNDFEREAAETMRRQTHPVDVWILDDSTDPRARARVDDFARASGARVVRRAHRIGFKAGAINGALTLLPPDVAYVAIVDADEFLAPDFVERCLPLFSSEDVAFVQANHRCVNTHASWFTRYLGIGVDLHWRHYQPYRNRYGVVNMLGHGAVVRRDVLESLGGFPEVTCEDLAFTVVARVAGYRGVFATDVMCGETFPEDFAAMRRRHLRWSWATVEFLRRNLRPLLGSRLRVHEKLDVILPSLNLPAVFLLVGFLVAAQGVRWVGGAVLPFSDPVVMGLSAFASLAPLAMFADLARRPLFAAKAILVNTVAYVALFPVSILGVLRGMARPAEFLVTPKGRAGPLRLREALALSRFDVACGLLLLGVGYVGFGMWGLAQPIALSAVSAPLLIWSTRRALRSLDRRQPEAGVA